MNEQRYDALQIVAKRAIDLLEGHNDINALREAVEKLSEYPETV